MLYLSQSANVGLRHWATEQLDNKELGRAPAVRHGTRVHCVVCSASDHVVCSASHHAAWIRQWTTYYWYFLDYLLNLKLQITGSWVNGYITQYYTWSCCKALAHRTISHDLDVWHRTNEHWHSCHHASFRSQRLVVPISIQQCGGLKHYNYDI